MGHQLHHISDTLPLLNPLGVNLFSFKSRVKPMKAVIYYLISFEIRCLCGTTTTTCICTMYMQLINNKFANVVGVVDVIPSQSSTMYSNSLWHQIRLLKHDFNTTHENKWIARQLLLLATVKWHTLKKVIISNNKIKRSVTRTQMWNIFHHIHVISITRNSSSSVTS